METRNEHGHVRVPGPAMQSPKHLWRFSALLVVIGRSEPLAHALEAISNLLETRNHVNFAFGGSIRRPLIARFG
jgi:hypothetical protein